MRISVLIAFLVGCGATPAATEGASAPPRDVVRSTAVEVGGALLAPMPVGVTSFGAASTGAHVVALGGYFGAPHAYSREGQSRALMRLALDGGRWEEVDALEHGLQGLALVEHEGRVCRVGGSVAESGEGEPSRMRSVADVACWTEDDGWEALPPLPEGRSSHGAARIGDTVYVVGGWRIDGDRDRAEWLDTLLALDLAAPTAWRTISAPSARRALAVAAAGGRLVVIGGLTPERQVSRRVDVYDPSTGTWTRGPDFPGDAFGLAATGLGDAVVASGRDGALRRWRVGDASWQRVGTLAFPRFFHQLVAADDAVIALGGIGGMQRAPRTRHVERIELDVPTSVATWVMPYPGRAKNRQAVFVVDDFLYLVGGNETLAQHDFALESFSSEGWRLHLPSMRWDRVADYPAPRQTMQTVVAGERAIAVGGFGHDGRAPVTHADAFVLDLSTGRWRGRAGLPRGRTQFGLAEHDGALWVFGGLDYDPARPDALRHVTSILTAPIDDPDAPFAPIEASLPGSRRAFAGAVHGGAYYLVGGMREGFQPVEDCLRFDFDARTFTPIGCPRAPRISGELVALGDRLYLGAGSVRTAEGMSAERSVEAYDPGDDAWSVAVDALPFETRHARMLRYRDRLLVVSTHREDGRILLALVDPR